MKRGFSCSLPQPGQEKLTGISNANFKPDFTRNSIFRKILTVKGDELPLTILKMMDEYYVKNKELTVLPYTLKYIRENFDL